MKSVKKQLGSRPHTGSTTYLNTTFSFFTDAIQLLRFAAKNERIRREWSNFCWTNTFYRKHIVNTGWRVSDQRHLCGVSTFDANKDMHVRLQKLPTVHQEREVADLRAT